MELLSEDVGYEGAGFMMLAEFFNHGRVVVSGHGLGLADMRMEFEAARALHPDRPAHRPRLPRRAHPGRLRGRERDPAQPHLPAVLKATVFYRP